jgi:hypothetical protein
MNVPCHAQHHERRSGRGRQRHMSARSRVSRRMPVPLRSSCEREVQVPPPLAAYVIHEVCAGLAAAFASRAKDRSPLRWVHRELRRDSVRIGRDLSPAARCCSVAAARRVAGPSRRRPQPSSRGGRTARAREEVGSRAEVRPRSSGLSTLDDATIRRPWWTSRARVRHPRHGPSGRWRRAPHRERCDRATSRSSSA